MPIAFMKYSCATHQELMKKNISNYFWSENSAKIEWFFEFDSQFH